MAASTLALTYTELRRWIGRQIGHNRNPSVWDSTTQTDCLDVLKAGLRQFYNNPLGHIWSFLKPSLRELTLNAPYSTGTVAVASGVVTLTGGTWPSWAAQGELWINDEWKTVNTRNSNSGISLDDLTITGLTGETYVLMQREYDLPDEFAGLIEPFTMRRDTYGGPIKTVNEATLRSMDGYPPRTGTPEYAAILSAAPISSQESKARASFAPLADREYRLWYRMAVVPPMLDGSNYVYPYGGALYAETILLSCLDKAMQTFYESEEKHPAYLESLKGSIEFDRRMNKPETFGFGVYSDGYGRGEPGEKVLSGRVGSLTIDLVGSGEDDDGGAVFIVE